MGNCLTKCLGKCDRRRKYQTRYTEGKRSVEFESLIDDDENNIQHDMGSLLTDREQQLLRTGQFDALVLEQSEIDKQLEEEFGESDVLQSSASLDSSLNKLAKQEEDLRRKEEAAYEAKREAALVARLQRAREKTGKKATTINGARPWLAEDEDWEVVGDRDDDFDMFLAGVKARSVAVRAQLGLHAGQGDGQSSTSSNAHTKDRSLTEGSSLDLEWDHEAGMESFLRHHSHTEENSEELSSLHNMAATAPGSQNSSDLEWDDSYLSANEYEQRQLLGLSGGNRTIARR